MAGQAAKLVARQSGRRGAAYWLYEHVYEGGIAELLEKLDAMLREDRRLQVTAMILICKEDMLGSLDGGRSGSPLSAEVVRLDRDTGMASVSVSGEGSGGPGMVRIAKMQDPFVYLAVTDGSAAFVDRALVPFVQSLYPGVSEAALSSAEMRGALDILERRSGGTVRIAGVEACPEQDGAGGGRGGPDAGEVWDGAHGSSAACADAPYRDALDEAAEGGRRIGRVQMRLVRDGVPSMECQISRRCLLRFRLSMQPFCTSALPYMAGLASGKTRLYSGRSRMENGGRIRALVIILDRDAFGDGRENERLVRTIRAMPRTMGSTYHLFPFVHRSLVDYIDGSTFDVWATSTNRITIVPQLRATHAAVARLVNHIFERFAEGRVEEYQEAQQWRSA